MSSLERQIQTLEEDVQNPCFGSEIHNKAVAQLHELKCQLAAEELAHQIHEGVLGG